MASGREGPATAPPPPQHQPQSLPPLYAQRPAYSFTIPSLHNDSNAAAGQGVQLECRVYHPPGYVAGLMKAMGSDGKVEGEGDEEGEDGDDRVRTGRRRGLRRRMVEKKKAAIIAHPYAPLGGSYDDPVVGNAGAEMLALGWVVGTFCFR